jgi:two-component system sensor histidine kinase KdpD
LEIVASALHRATRILGGHKVTMIQAGGLPLLGLDAVLCEQALFNLLDNAPRYAPCGSTVTIRTKRRGGHVRLLLLDEGDGIRAGEEERIFVRFQSVCDKRATPGTGLGLAISRGFVEAMDGTMKATNLIDRPGAIFTMSLQISQAAMTPEGVS